MKCNSKGFSLVEIAIVLVIIGLLLGGILKGQEMINSAKVRNLADLASSSKAAYLGFLDRYRAVPGDWSASSASDAIGVEILGGGNDNGRLDNPDSGADTYEEANGLWEQISKAGFIQGAYVGTNEEPTTTNNLAPLNAFNNVVTVGRTDDFEGTSPVALHVVIGRGVPVNIMRELDVKMDDGLPETGVLRATVDDARVVVFGLEHSWGGRESGCVTSDATMLWDIAGDAQDCNAVLLF